MRTLSRRDTLLVLLGALSMHLFSAFFSTPSDRNFLINSHLRQYQPLPNFEPLPPPPEPPVTVYPHKNPTTTAAPSAAEHSAQPDTPPPPPVPVDQARTLPETTIVSHAPGWTIFRNLYMADGTFYIVSKQPSSSFPEIRKMISVAMYAEASPENIAAREPTREDLDFLSPEHAKRLWGGDIERGQRNRVWSVHGPTFFCNDPDQFLDHYYHFVAELFLGAWAFWSGSFSAASLSSSSSTPSLFSSPQHNQIPLASASPFIPSNASVVEPIHRVIFAHSTSDGWRDRPGFNAYFLRAAFPSLTVEVESDWTDRIAATPKFDPKSNLRSSARAWHFPLILVADRSASFRGEACGSRTQRTAAEAFEAMMAKGTLETGWWEPVRRAVVQFAGGDPDAGHQAVTRVTRGGPVGAAKFAKQQALEKGPENADSQLPMPSKVVVTYISRQATRRCLISEDHELLVDSLEEMAQRKGWELNVIVAERLTKDEQVRIMSETTVRNLLSLSILVSVLVMMPLTRVSAVIEMFFPGGFAHDYQWTTHALGMRHFAVWNDTYRTLPNKPDVEYPEGFQGSQIPAYGPAIVQLIEDRVEGRV